MRDESVAKTTAWTLADGDVTVTPNSQSQNAVAAEVRGRFFIARNVPLQNGTNSIEADTDADTLAGNSPSSDTVTDVALDTSLNVSYTYNANGDLILKSEEGGSVLWSYSYSVDGWLTRVEGPDGFVEEYAYDPIGRKYKITTTENTDRYFVYDGGSIVLELEEDSGNYLLEKEHVRGTSLGGGIGGLLYTRDADGTTGYFHYDGRGNVVSVTNEAREEIAYYEYDAWGNILTACGSLANEFRYSTKQASLGTGLIDFGDRWHDPSVGRWLQRDPAAYERGANLYTFALNSPLNFYDPWGDVIEVYVEKGKDWRNVGTAKTKDDIDNLEKSAKKRKESGKVTPGFSDLDKIVLTVCGKALLTSLATSDKVVKIYVHTTRKTDPAEGTKPDDFVKGITKGQKARTEEGEITGTGEGTGCEIHYEANKTLKADGGTWYSDERLVHELQHALDYVSGTFNVKIVAKAKGGKFLLQAECDADAKMNQYIREKDGKNTTRQRKKHDGFDLPKE